MASNFDKVKDSVKGLDFPFKCIDNYAEIVTVEVTLATVIFFNVDILREFHCNINNRNKTLYLGGDFNIDLLHKKAIRVQ